MKLLKGIALFFFIGVFAASCTKDSPEPELVLEEVKLSDISYGESARNIMDVYLPEGRNENTPLVVLIHGGYWLGGDKSDMTFIQDQLMNNKIASVNINYDFADIGHQYDDMLEDVNKALTSLKANAREWGVRESGFTLLGVSSGAHMALLYAYGIQKPGEVQSVISVAGPTDLANLTQNPIEKAMLAGILLGVSPVDMENNPRTIAASPVYQVEKAVPTLIFHGDIDEIVPFSQSALLSQRLEEKAVDHKLIVLEGAKHDVTLNPLHLVKMFSEVQTWVAKYSK